MRKFCKIFEFPDYQVLIRMEEDKDGYGVVQETHLKGVHPKMILGFDKEEGCKVCFENYSEANAKEFLDCVIKMFE